MKGKNIGFAKLEVRNDQCKLSVNVKKVYVGGNNMGVYLLASKKEIFLGNIFIRNGAGEFRAIVQSSNVENSGTTIDECYGLTVHEVENAWQSYTTIWEDAVARAAQVDLADVTSEKQIEKDMTRENITAVPAAAPSFAVSAVAEIEREIEQNERTDGAVHSPSTEETANIPQAEGLTEMEQIPGSRESGSRKTALSSPPPVAVSDKTPCESFSEPPIVLEGINSVPYGCAAAEPGTAVSEAREAETMPVQENGQQEAGIYGNAEQVTEVQENIFQETVSQEEASGEGAQQDQTKRAEAQQTQQSPFNNGFLNRLASLAAERYKNRPIMEEMNRITGKTSQEEESPSVQAPVNQNLETAQELQPETPPHITNQTPPHLYIGDPAELEALEQEEKEESSHEKLWEYLKKVHTKMPAFDYEHGCEILTIKPQDIGILPRETWVYGNNSFLLHGYYNYRYLILAKLFNPEGKPRYLLGIPGHYYSNEKYMASMFGFPNFVLAKQQPAEDGRFGFWYTDVRLGD